MKKLMLFALCLSAFVAAANGQTSRQISDIRSFEQARYQALVQRDLDIPPAR